MNTALAQSFFRQARLIRAATALVLAAAVGAQAQDTKKKEFSLGEKTSEAFQKLKPLQDAQNWNGMLALLDQIPNVQPGSYDEALILDMKAKIYGMTNQLSKAIAPWERVVELSDQHNYIPEKDLLNIIFYLGQLFAQEATSTKDPKLAQQHFTKALKYFRRFIEKTPRPTPEQFSTYATIVFYKAIADPNNVDQALLKEAREIIDRGLTSSIKPKDTFYQLLLALQQQQNDMAGAAEILELLLKQNPAKKDSWAMLMAIYLQLSEKSKERPELSRDYLTRAIVTFERAQAAGFMNTPKDNMTLVTLYLMANQFTKGTELLYSGMKKGIIESEPNNWRLLGRFYVEASQPQKAIEMLSEATKLFPKSGEIELQIAQIYLQLEDTKKAHAHAKAARDKGNFESAKPYGVNYLVAYTAYEIGDLDTAAKAIAECEKYPEAQKDPQLPKLRDVVREGLAARDEKTKEKEKTKDKSPKKTASSR